MKMNGMLFVLILMVGFAYAAQSDCLDSEVYKPYTDKCVPKCTVAQDYVGGECLLKCRDMENYVWSVEENKCVHMCSLDSSSYFCKDYLKGEKVSVCEDVEFCKGSFGTVSGRVFVERGIEVIAATSGLKLLAGDTVVVDEGTRVVINFVDSDEIVLDKKTKFKIPGAEKVAAEKISFTERFFGGIFTKLRGWFGGEKFELKQNTDSGRRA